MIHIFPLDDLRDHDTSPSGHDCHCNPRILVVQQGTDHEILVIHNPYDARDVSEQWPQFLKTVESWFHQAICP